MRIVIISESDSRDTYRLCLGNIGRSSPLSIVRIFELLALIVIYLGTFGLFECIRAMCKIELWFKSLENGMLCFTWDKCTVHLRYIYLAELWFTCRNGYSSAFTYGFGNGIFLSGMFCSICRANDLNWTMAQTKTDSHVFRVFVGFLFPNGGREKLSRFHQFAYGLTSVMIHPSDLIPIAFRSS